MIRCSTADELSLMLEIMRAGNELEARHIERIRGESGSSPQSIAQQVYWFDR